MDFPGFIAIETGDEEALPVAISWALPDGQIKHALIQPDDDWLDEELPYTRPGWDHVAQVPRKGFAMQMFNHATHHRSQVTAELHRMGIDYGITDLPYNPLSRWWK